MMCILENINIVITTAIPNEIFSGPKNEKYL